MNSRTFICKLSSFSNSPRCKRHPNLILMHLLVSSKLVPFALVIFHCLILNFQSTKKVPVLRDCLILSLPGMNRPGLVILFVVVANNLAVDELAELPGSLRTPDLSFLLISKPWFEGEKKDSDISKLTFSSFPLLASTSWCKYLFIGLKLCLLG